MTTRPIIVLTGFEEIRTFVRTERDAQAIPGPTTCFLIFNDGAFRLPCDEETFTQIIQFWNSFSESRTPPKPARVASLPLDIPEGASAFSASDLPPPPDEVEDEDPDDDVEAWSGAEDEAEDGVGQL